MTVFSFICVYMHLRVYIHTYVCIYIYTRTHMFTFEELWDIVIYITAVENDFPVSFFSYVYDGETSRGESSNTTCQRGLTFTYILHLPY